MTHGVWLGGGGDFGPQPGCGGEDHRWPPPCMGERHGVWVERYASGCVGRHRSGVMVGWGGAPGGVPQGTPEDSPCASCTSPRIVLFSRRLSLKRVSCCFRAGSLRPPSCGCCAVRCVRTIAELPWVGLFCPLSHFICSDEGLIILANKRPQIALKRAEKFLGTIKHALEILWEVCRLVKNGVMLWLLRL